MADKFTREKAENCFISSVAYNYTIGFPVDGKFLEKLGQLGELQIKANFRRPFFMLDCGNGVKLKGVLGQRTFKAGFDETNYTQQIMQLESWLNENIGEENEGNDG